MMMLDPLSPHGAGSARQCVSVSDELVDARPFETAATAASAAVQADVGCQASTPMMSDSFMIRSSSPSSLISVPDHLPNSTRSPTLMSIGISLPALVAAAGADRDDFALRGLFLGGVGNDDAALGLFFGVDALDHDTVMQRTKFGFSHDGSFWRLGFRI